MIDRGRNDGEEMADRGNGGQRKMIYRGRNDGQRKW